MAGMDPGDDDQSSQSKHLAVCRSSKFLINYPQDMKQINMQIFRTRRAKLMYAGRYSYSFFTNW
jgi:hypothetical protein